MQKYRISRNAPAPEVPVLPAADLEDGFLQKVCAIVEANYQEKPLAQPANNKQSGF